MTSIPLMDGAGKRESERRCLVPSVYPLFSWLNSPLQDSSLARDCLFVKNGKGFPSCVFRVLKHFRSSLHSRGQAVTAQTEGANEKRRNWRTKVRSPSFSSLLLLVFLVRALITEKVSIAFTASIKRQ